MSPVSEPARKHEAAEGEVVSVKVAGRDLRLRTDNGEELAREAAELVSAEVRRAKNSPAAPGTNDAVLLAALNLAGELLAARRDLAECRKETAGRTQALIAKLDGHLGD